MLGQTHTEGNTQMSQSNPLAGPAALLRKHAEAIEALLDAAADAERESRLAELDLDFDPRAPIPDEPLSRTYPGSGTKGGTHEERVAKILSVAREEWLRDVAEPPAKGKDRISTYIRDAQGLGWDWSESYKRNGQFAWCGAFAAYCFGAAGIRADIRRRSMASCYRLWRWARGTERWMEGAAVADAKPGDIVVVGPKNGKRWGAHITICEEVDLANDVIRTYEGNARGTGPNGERQEGVIRHARPFSRPGQAASLYRVMFVIRPVASDFDASRSEPVQPSSSASTSSSSGMSQAQSSSSASASGASSTARRAAAWSLAAYMAGDNDLEGAALDDILELEAVGSSAEVAAVVQVDRARGFDSSNANWTTTRRYSITKGDGSRRIASRLEAELGETNSGDPAIVSAFFDWAQTSAPAERQLLVLWNHGSGFYTPPEWMPTDRGFRDGERRAVATKLRRSFFASTRKRILDAEPALRSILYDDESQDCLDAQELARLVSQIAGQRRRPIDVLGMDACLMSMIEVAWQLRGSVRVMVASQELEPADGWPYDQVLAALGQRPDASPEDVGRTLVAAYLDSYRPEHRVTQSAIALDKLGPIKDSLDRLADLILAGSQLERDARMFALFRAHSRSIAFYDRNYVDIASFARNLRDVSTDVAMVHATLAVEEALRTSGAVLAAGGKGTDLEQVCGLSIFLPPAIRPRADRYSELQFAADSRWGALVDAVAPPRS
jgi:hypothetical protein